MKPDIEEIKNHYSVQSSAEANIICRFIAEIEALRAKLAAAEEFRVAMEEGQKKEIESLSARWEGLVTGLTKDIYLAKEKLALSEAAGAELRAALEYYANDPLEKGKFIVVDEKREFICDVADLGHRARKALASDHGKAYLEVVRAAESLVEKLEKVHADLAYQTVWTISQLHVGQYCGPTYIEELRAAKAALDRLPWKGE